MDNVGIDFGTNDIEPPTVPSILLIHANAHFSAAEWNNLRRRGICSMSTDAHMPDCLSYRRKAFLPVFLAIAIHDANPNTPEDQPDPYRSTQEAPPNGVTRHSHGTTGHAPHVVLPMPGQSPLRTPGIHPSRRPDVRSPGPKEEPHSVWENFNFMPQSGLITGQVHKGDESSPTKRTASSPPHGNSRWEHTNTLYQAPNAHNRRQKDRTNLRKLLPRKKIRRSRQR